MTFEHSTSASRVNQSASANRYSRRQFIVAGIGALTSMPVLAKLAANPQVVIVGAGAAGLSAARTLMNAGLTVAVLEASDRVGGRAHTDTRVFGVPFDVGAHWLHYGSSNPYLKYAQNNGYTTSLAPEKYRLFIDSQEMTDSQIDSFWDTYANVHRKLGQAGKRRLDISAQDAISGMQGAWIDTAKFMIGPWSMGKEFSDFSALDWWESTDGEDYICKEGYGTLIANQAAGIPVSLNSAVSKIDWSGTNISIETTEGGLTCEAVIVTVSTGALASSSIRFVPELPVSKQESFQKISMGAYEHIAIQFKEDFFELGPDGYVIFQMGAGGQGFGTLTNASGTGLAYCDVGGTWARELVRESPQYRISYAVDELKKAFGSKVERNFLKGYATSWADNPWTYGSFASAEPGAHHLRRELRNSVADRIFFAGEACHRSQWATVGGAYLSGIEAANTVKQFVV